LYFLSKIRSDKYIKNTIIHAYSVYACCASSSCGSSSRMPQY
jgi:hypothetical protein